MTAHAEAPRVRARRELLLSIALSEGDERLVVREGPVVDRSVSPGARREPEKPLRLLLRL